MADTYEHEKPYQLTGQYQETPAPSGLGALIKAPNIWNASITPVSP